MNFKLLNCIILLFLPVFVSGCLSSIADGVTKTAQVIWDPSIPVGDPQNGPTTLDISMFASDDTNPNIDGEPSPVEFQIFQLVDDSKFLLADYNNMVNDLEDELGKNYIDHQDYVLSPGQFKHIETFEVEEDTIFIGVMGRFSEPSVTEWKKTVKVKSVGKAYHLLVFLDNNKIELEVVE